jgi:predicted ArsR family transcriptional regulator
VDRLSALRFLGDGTRFLVYRQVASSGVPMSTAQVAEGVGLHPNTVRPHLERLRGDGLLEVDRRGQGTVGRPQHRYRLAPDAPAPFSESPAHSALSEMLAGVAEELGAGAPQALEAGRSRGRRAPAGAGRAGKSCVEALVGELEEMGFDPATARQEATVTVSFGRCPFREIAEAHPELVCHMHQGLVEGIVERLGGAAVQRFGTLSDQEPCQVDLAVG